ncbi:hypothetical protein P154DRAFT_535138 [Amniculicola lignicola CBS 123094]|uniref:Uncharacterized protein n=1 Tax=Amniculicola lignicola CBS 123094 TaxID=1392246 RepID=A0A6A5WLD1_9PLEO|nr:hypothetical protein P154DRAFT_535138 [Amniculicola lignicola CBS 123094]
MEDFEPYDDTMQGIDGPSSHEPSGNSGQQLHQGPAAAEEQHTNWRDDEARTQLMAESQQHIDALEADERRDRSVLNQTRADIDEWRPKFDRSLLDGRKFFKKDDDLLGSHEKLAMQISDHADQFETRFQQMSLRVEQADKAAGDWHLLGQRRRREALPLSAVYHYEDSDAEDDSGRPSQEAPKNSAAVTLDANQHDRQSTMDHAQQVGPSQPNQKPRGDKASARLLSLLGYDDSEDEDHFSNFEFGEDELMSSPMAASTSFRPNPPLLQQRDAFRGEQTIATELSSSLWGPSFPRSRATGSGGDLTSQGTALGTNPNKISRVSVPGEANERQAENLISGRSSSSGGPAPFMNDDPTMHLDLEMDAAPDQKPKGPGRQKKLEKVRPLPVVVRDSADQDWVNLNGLSDIARRTIEKDNNAMAKGKNSWQAYARMTNRGLGDSNCIQCDVISHQPGKCTLDDKDTACERCVASQRPCSKLISHGGILTAAYLPIGQSEDGWEHIRTWAEGTAKKRKHRD